MTVKHHNMYVVISEPRTGSTILSHKLELLDDVSCQGEIFHPDEIFCSVNPETIPDKYQRDRHPVEFLHNIMEQTYKQRGQSSLIGFKLFFDHNPLITKYVLDNRIPVILLERSNKLAQYSSLKIAKRTGKWNSDDIISKKQEELNKKRGKKVHFSLLEFVAFSIRSRFRFYSLTRKLIKSGTPYHYVCYEKMFKDNEWRNIIEFLNIKTEKIEVTSNLKKQNKGTLISRFSNMNYAYYCCKFLLLFPILPKLLNLTSDILKKA